MMTWREHPGDGVRTRDDYHVLACGIDCNKRTTVELCVYGRGG